MKEIVVGTIRLSFHQFLMEEEVSVPRNEVTPIFREIVQTGLETFKGQLTSYFSEVFNSSSYTDDVQEMVFHLS